jgi:integrase
VCGGRNGDHVIAKPRTSSGEARLVDLDDHTVATLLLHRMTPDAERDAWAEAYNDYDLMFAQPDGTPMPPDRLTKRFPELAKAAGLRPVRLHDLRHGQASLMLAAGVPIAVVSKRLGHSSIGITADTYSHLLEGVGHDAAERSMARAPAPLGRRPL